MSFKCKALLNIGREMDACKEKITSLDKQIEKEQEPTSQASNFQKLIKRVIKGNTLQMDREQAYLRLGNLALIRDSFFDEGYNTEGAFIKVCFRAEGQMHLRKVESFQNKLRVSRDASGVVPEYQLGEAQRTKSNAQQNASSAFENIAMYKGHFEHNLAGKELQHYQDAAIETSKYSERALSASMELLEEMEKANPQLKEVDSKNEAVKAAARAFQDVKKDVEDTLNLARNLEQVKRGKVLNKASAMQLLWKELSPGKDAVDTAKLLEVLERVLEKDKPEFRFEETLLPEQKYLAMIGGLSGHIEWEMEGEVVKLDKDGLPKTKNTKVELILKARCGLEPSLEEEKGALVAVHDQGKEITLQGCGFTHQDIIVGFNKRTERLTLQVYKMAIERKLIPCPTASKNKDLSAQSVWQQVSKTPKDDL